MWAIAGVSGCRGKPFCKRQCCAGERKGQPRCCFWIRGVPSKSVTEAVLGSRFSRLNCDPMNWIRCWDISVERGCGVRDGQPAWGRVCVWQPLTVRSSQLGEMVKHAVGAHTPANLLGPDCRGKACVCFQSSPGKSPVLPKHLASGRPAGRAAMASSLSLQLTILPNLKTVSE